MLTMLFTGGGLQAALPELLILEPSVDVKVDRDRARVLTERLAEVLRKGRYVRPAGAKSPCDSRDCALKIARKRGSERVLLSRISKPGREYLVETDFLNVESGRGEVRAGIRVPSLENRDLEAGVAALAREIEAGLKQRGYRPERILSWDDHARALVPGLTQYGRNQKRWSYFLAGGSLFLFQRYLTQRSRWMTARSEFQDPLPPLALAVALRNQPGAGAAAGNFYTENLRAKADARGRDLNLSLLLLGGLLAWNYLDAINDYRYGFFLSGGREFRAPRTYTLRHAFIGKREQRPEFSLSFTWSMALGESH